MHFIKQVHLLWQDKHFGKIPLFYPHTNPPATVGSSIKHFKKHSLIRAYNGETFFWGFEPQSGDWISFVFEKPIKLKRLVTFYPPIFFIYSYHLSIFQCWSNYLLLFEFTDSDFEVEISKIRRINSQMRPSWLISYQKIQMNHLRWPFKRSYLQEKHLKKKHSVLLVRATVYISFSLSFHAYMNPSNLIKFRVYIICDLLENLSNRDHWVKIFISKV